MRSEVFEPPRETKISSRNWQVREIESAERKVTIDSSYREFWKLEGLKNTVVSKGCFGRKTKFFRESEDFAGNRESWKFLGKYEVVKLNFRKFWDFFANFSQIIRTIFQNFGSTFIYTRFCRNSVCESCHPREKSSFHSIASTRCWSCFRNH